MTDTRDRNPDTPPTRVTEPTTAEERAAWDTLQQLRDDGSKGTLVSLPFEAVRDLLAARDAALREARACLGDMAHLAHQLSASLNSKTLMTVQYMQRAERCRLLATSHPEDPDNA